MNLFSKKIYQNTIMRYIFAGGLSYLIELAAIYTLLYYTPLGPVMSVAVGFWIGFAVAFMLQKVFAFKDDGISAKRLLRQSLTYSALVAFNYAFTLLFVSLFEPIIGLFIARTIALIITTAWNYIVYSKFIFK